MSHQDYVNWLPKKGETVYVTNPDWSEVDEELARVFYVDGVKTFCGRCYAKLHVYKKTYDTPGCLASPEGLCISCIKDIYGENVKTQKEMEKLK